jgi:hypothetical protein
MSTLEHPIVGPKLGHENRKAIFSLVFGTISMSLIVASAALVLFTPGKLNGNDLDWLMMPFLALIGGAVSAFIGSIAWIDVRRGITDKRLFEARLGTLLGGLAVFAVAAALVALVIVYLVLFFSFASAWDNGGGGGWD